MYGQSGSGTTYRPSSTSCCIASDGATYAHTASDPVGVSPWKNCMLKRTVAEVSRGGYLPKLPQDLGGMCSSQVAEAAPTRSIQSNARVIMKVCGEPVSKRATHLSCRTARPLWILILVVKEDSPMVTTPATRQGLAQRARGAAYGSGRRTLLREHRRRGLMASL